MKATIKMITGQTYEFDYEDTQMSNTIFRITYKDDKDVKYRDFPICNIEYIERS